MLVTAFISGVFGMVGGLVLMGVLTALMSVPAAMVTHGLIQSASNAWRAFLLRSHLLWGVLGWYALGAVAAALVLAVLAYQPSKAMVYLLLGASPLLLWLPADRFALDALKPQHAVVCGFLVTLVNALAGVAGAVLNLFFVTTAMTRHNIVAVKSAGIVIAHSVKLAYYGGPMLMAASGADMPPGWAILATIPVLMIGTWLGTQVLHLFTDAHFKQWSKWIITGVGGIYLVRAAMLVWG